MADGALPLIPSSVLVVIPALNEQATIGSVVTGVRAEGYDVLVVDDGSVDRTGPIAAAGGATVARLPINLGVGGALQCAFTYAVRNGYEAVVQCDADGQHSFDQIDDLLDEANATGADMVIGSRFRSVQTSMRVSALRRFAMRLLSAQASLAAGDRITDSTSGFRLIRKPLLSAFAQEFPTHYLGDTHEALVSAGRAGYVIVETSATMQVRSEGESSASSARAFVLAVRSAIVAATGLTFRTVPADKARLMASSKNRNALRNLRSTSPKTPVS
ncbi:MAG: glycosyltransferase family 2 protein [Acidimicrobiales bacterium]